MVKEDELVKFDDGFTYYWPKGSTRGALSAYNLRQIADKLDEMNQAWSDQLDEYFKEHND